MFSHAQIWNALDKLAESKGLSASGLAKAAGLDATSFNKSKRVTPEGRQRWPTTESVAKCLSATGASLDEFTAMVQGVPASHRTIPLIGMAQAGSGGYFDDAGFPAGGSWDEVNLPSVDDANAYALEITGDNRILEIGTGSGYTAAVMARLGSRVTTVDRYRTLAADAQERFRTLGLTNIVQRHGDGERGLEGEGPFDRIAVWASFDALPRNFADLLSSGGIMVCAIGVPEERQILVKLTKVGSRFERVDLGHVRFQPLARGLAARL